MMSPKVLRLLPHAKAFNQDSYVDVDIGGDVRITSNNGGEGEESRVYVIALDKAQALDLALAILDVPAPRVTCAQCKLTVDASYRPARGLLTVYAPKGWHTLIWRAGILRGYDDAEQAKPLHFCGVPCIELCNVSRDEFDKLPVPQLGVCSRCGHTKAQHEWNGRHMACASEGCMCLVGRDYAGVWTAP